MDIKELFNFFALNNIWDYLEVIFLICFVIQLFFYIVMFSRLAFYKQKENTLSNNLPVSIIICAKNERDNLLKFLPHYFSQDYPAFEVIVVNDHSVDDSSEVLKAFSLQYKNLKIVNVPDNDRFFGSKKFALTLGIKAAKYENLLLTDADCKPSSNQWVKLMSAYENNKEIILGFGSYEKQRGILNKLIRFETLYTAIQYLSFALAKIPYMGVGRNLAYSSTLFFKNKGFASHQHLLSGDDDLFINEVANAKNTQVVIDAKAHTISTPKTTFKSWITQKKRHFLTGTHYKFKHQLILGILQLSQLAFMLLFILLVVKIRPVHLIVILFVIRYLIQMLIFRQSAKRLKCTDLVLLTPFFELFFMLFNPLLVISNIIQKNTKWN